MKHAITKLPMASANWLYLLLCFPIVDYVLRKFVPISFISSLWDDGVLIVLFLFCVTPFLRGARIMPGIKHVFSAFFVLGLGMTVADMSNVDASVEGFRAIYEYVLTFFIGFYLIASEEQLAKFMKVLGLVSFVVAFIGVMQVVLGVQTPEAWVNAGESTRTRAFSIVTSPNVLGSFMAFASPLAIGLFLNSKDKKERIVWAIVSLTTIAALLFTMSRGAWFAFGFVVFVGCYLWKKRLTLYLALAAIVLAAGLSFVPHMPVLSTVKDRVGTLFTAEYLEKSESDGRIARWKNSYYEMMKEPLFGKGLGHYGGAVGSRHFGTIYSDSYLFKTIAETGILGTGLLLTLMFMGLRYALRFAQERRKSPHYFLYVGIFCGLLAAALHNMVENIFEVPFMSTYFWLTTGFLVGLLAEKTLQKQR
ncbi:UNVERIFIED_CONTAM: putative inorganic carbon (HCO3(-)) transporter [Brevibacillus sp. OAP136]